MLQAREHIRIPSRSGWPGNQSPLKFILYVQVCIKNLFVLTSIFLSSCSHMRLISILCAGDAASKKFKNLRDAFVKEHKVVTADANQPSGSGGGPTRVHVPSEFYHELLLLKAHIGVRRYVASSHTL